MHNNWISTSASSASPLSDAIGPGPSIACPEELLIAKLGPHHRKRVLAHLLSLSPDDRRLRFGSFANDEAIERYVKGIHFTRDAVFGAVDSCARLAAVVHVAFERGGDLTSAELGISVHADFRRRGLGLTLLRRAAEHARNRGAKKLVMTYVPDNTALEELTKRCGMHLSPDPLEPLAYLDLDPPSAANLLVETIGETAAALELGLRVADAEECASTSA